MATSSVRLGAMLPASVSPRPCTFSRSLRLSIPCPRIFGVKSVRTAVAEENSDQQDEKWDYASYQALLEGGEEVVGVLENMIKVLEDVTGLDKDNEDTAAQMAAVAAVGQRLDKLDGSFLAALDLMIEQTKREKDDKKKQLLQFVKEATLAQVTQKASPEVQILAMLTQAPDKEHRRQIMRCAAGGGGGYNTKDGGKFSVPGANILDLANQANDLISSMEDKPKLPDRKLLAKLVLIREEAHDMLGGGILDERNKPALQSLPEPEVNFLGKLVSVRPSPALRQTIEDVMQGRNEGADLPDEQPNKQNPKRKNLPVRPGMFLETITKLLDTMYDNKSAAGITVQHLDWVYRNTMEILQDMAFGEVYAKDEEASDNEDKGGKAM